MDNLKALEVPSFTSDERKQLEEFYLREVHDHIRGKY